MQTARITSVRTLLRALGLCSALATLALPASAGTMVTFDVENLGSFTVELYDTTPLHRDNFLAYVNAGLYNGTIIHRNQTEIDDTTGETIYSILQGGGYITAPEPTYIEHITTFAPILNEAALGGSNTRMTLGAARTPDPDSATSEWFINMDDNNSDVFDPGMQGADFPGYTVFGEVIAGHEIVEEIYFQPVWTWDPVNASRLSFLNLPMMGSYDGSTAPALDDYVHISNAYEVTATPEPGVLGVMGIGMAGLISRQRRKRKQA